MHESRSSALIIYIYINKDNKRNLRSVRLEAVGNGEDGDASAEAVEEGDLPALALVLLAGLETPQPAGRGVVLGAVGGGRSRRRREGSGGNGGGGLRVLQGAGGPHDGIRSDGGHGCDRYR